MQRGIFFAGAVFLAVISVGCMSMNQPEATEPAMSDQEMIAGAMALDAAFLAALNAGNAAEIASLYAPDAESFPPDVLEVVGPEAIGAASAAGVQATPGMSFEIVDSHNMVAGAYVIGWGRFRVNIPGEGGQMQVNEGRYTDVKTSQGGKWVYVVDHASFPVPAAQ